VVSEVIKSDPSVFSSSQFLKKIPCTEVRA